MAKRNEVRCRREIRGQGERGQNAQKMGTSGEAVQRTHRESRMTVVVRSVSEWPRACASQCPADPPNSDADQGEPHQALTPSGYCLDRQRVAQQQHQKPDAEHSRSVSESPSDPGPPGTTVSADGVRRDRSQVIGPQEDVNEPGNEPSERDYHAIRRAGLRSRDRSGPGVRRAAAN